MNPLSLSHYAEDVLAVAAVETANHLRTLTHTATHQPPNHHNPQPPTLPHLLQLGVGQHLRDGHAVRVKKVSLARLNELLHVSAQHPRVKTKHKIGTDARGVGGGCGHSRQGAQRVLYGACVHQHHGAAVLAADVP